VFGRQTRLGVRTPLAKRHRITEFVAVREKLENLGTSCTESAVTGDVMMAYKFLLLAVYRFETSVFGDMGERNRKLAIRARKQKRVNVSCGQGRRSEISELNSNCGGIFPAIQRTV